MKTRKELIDLCLTFAGSVEDYPFDDDNWTCMRHGHGGKIFALIFERDGNIWVNLKNLPDVCATWEEACPSIVPAYHMNKKHWLSIILDGTVPDRLISDLIADSYRITLK